MAREKQKFPSPTKRFMCGSWCIRWSWERKVYEFSTGYKQEDEEKAETARASLEYSMRTGDWKEWTDKVHTIQKWKKIVATEDSAYDIIPESEKVLQKWVDQYSATATEDETISRLKPLKVLAEKYDLLTLTKEEAAEFFKSLSEDAPPRYLSDRVTTVMNGQELYRHEIIEALNKAGYKFLPKKLSIALANRKIFKFIPDKNKHRIGKYKALKSGRILSSRTRNKYMVSFRMFYKWAAKEGYIRINPFEDIKKARIEDHTDIVYCDRDERAQIVAAAKHHQFGLAVWIAFYAGLRRSEMIRLRWENIELTGRWMHIKKTKTGKARHAPISPVLLKILKKVKKKSGFVIDHWHVENRTPENVAISDIKALRKLLPEHADKIGWNIFRHTYGSLLAQSGEKTIDQICALMGNTPDVCRRHYANMIPKWAEQTGIDLID